jgi:2-polyprenyl-6-hydroxyphenyl methylase/3-demethylubiquinone-9 3-methyltransferase
MGRGLGGFRFGKNWKKVVRLFNEESFAEADKALSHFFSGANLAGKTFIDVGCGSGIVSLVARRRGAKVYSMDVDEDSVACAGWLKKRFFPGDPLWEIASGSILDQNCVRNLPQADFVYSWGVLHHTGDLWLGLKNCCHLVRPQGFVGVSLYNDQGWKSQCWLTIKKAHLHGGWIRGLVLALFIPYFFLGGLACDVVGGKNPLERYRTGKYKRGMSAVHDWIDWLGGYPFEVARPSEVMSFFEDRGFRTVFQNTLQVSSGCNEFVFQKRGNEP